MLIISPCLVGELACLENTGLIKKMDQVKIDMYKGIFKRDDLIILKLSSLAPYFLKVFSIFLRSSLGHKEKNSRYQFLL
jgi:hypothetical protein